MEMDNLPKRKRLRLERYDYSTPGAYFVTICTHEKRCILSDITVGAIHESPATTHLLIIISARAKPAKRFLALMLKKL